MMKTSILIFNLILNEVTFGNAFTCISSNTNLKQHILFASPASNNGDNLVNENENKALPKMAGFAAALILGWGVATNPSVASPPVDYSSFSISSITVSALNGISDSDIADFSLPSYGDVVAADKNSNLKGTKNLLGDEYTKSEVVSEAPKEKMSAKEAKIAEQNEKDAKAAAKAARRAEMKAARERQMAEAEAALK